MDVDDYFKSVVDDIESRGNDKEEPSLENVESALASLGNPERNSTVILVGGTNGKGSTVELISEGLQHLGFDVGTFKSPHLVSCRERVRINGEMISKKEFIELYELIEESESNLTFFEFMTVLAYKYFSKKSVDYAIMEVGMGGRFDATNSASSEISVITNVGLDHTDYLGESKEEIMRQKAGIVSEGKKVISRVESKVLEKTVDRKDAEMIRPAKISREGKSYGYRGESFKIPLNGSFQKQNLENAVTALNYLEGEINNLENAFMDVECPGRMEKISENPLYIQDGAHNPEALRTILPDLPENFRCIFNAVKTKDIEQMITILEEKASKFYFTQSDVEWSEEPEKIAELTEKDYEIYSNPREAEKQALEGRDVPVVATGSLYLIGNLKNFNRAAI